MIAYAPHTLVVHHSAGLQNFEGIRASHISGNYEEIAYNAVIERDGTVRWGRPLGTKPAANAGQNSGTAAVCVVGWNGNADRPEWRWTDAQISALSRFLVGFRLLYPGAKVIGHRDLKATDCPGLEIRDLLGE